MRSLSIIIPAYNEEKNISRLKTELIPEIRKITSNYEIIIVNDGSKDNTENEIIKLKEFDSKIILISYNPNGGMGYALKRGIEKSSKELTVFLDSDLTFHPSDIFNLLKKFEQDNLDFVIGYPKKIKASLWRIILSRIINNFYFLLLGKKIKAITPIFRLYKTQQLKELTLESNGFEINVEILYKLLAKKRRFEEVPIVLGKRTFGESKLNYFRESKNHLLLIKKILYWKFIKNGKNNKK